MTFKAIFLALAYFLNSPSFQKREYVRLLLRYNRIPRFHEKKICFFTSKKKRYMFRVPDVPSFLAQYKSLFVDECSRFSNDTEKNFTIIDFGANIGMSLLYFYITYPNAIVTAFEADPNIFSILKNNISVLPTSERNRLKIINKAVWVKETTLSFSGDGSDGGRVSDEENCSAKIQAINVREFLSKYEHVDFLKIDVEGSERVIIPALSDNLSKIDRIFLEYHSEFNTNQCLADIISVLSNAGFRLFIHEGYCGRHPYTESPQVAGYDMMLEIYARR